MWAPHTLGADPLAGNSAGALKRLQEWCLFLFLAVNGPLVAAAGINLLSPEPRQCPLCEWGLFLSLRALLVAASPTEQNILSNGKPPASPVWLNMLFKISEPVFFIAHPLCGWTMTVKLPHADSHKPSFLLRTGKKPRGRIPFMWKEFGREAHLTFYQRKECL